MAHTGTQSTVRQRIERRNEVFLIFSDFRNPGAVTLSEADGFEADSGHYEGEGLPWEFAVSGLGIHSRHFERPPLQTFLVQEEPVRVPSEDLDALTVPGEEDEDVAAHRGKGRFRKDQVEQRVDALAHVHGMLAHEVTVPGFEGEHHASFADRRRS